MRRLFSLALLFLVAGCASGPRVPYVQKVHGFEMLSGTADLQTMVTKQTGDLTQFCASRMADVADTKSSNISAGGRDLQGNRGGIGGGSTQGALDLGGRSTSLLIIREFMYRACELCMNQNLSKDEAKEVYFKFLDASVTVAQTVTNVGLSAVADEPVGVSQSAGTGR